MKISKWLPGLITLIGCTVTALMIALGEDDEMIVSSVIPPAVKTVSVKKADYRIQVPAWGFIAPEEAIDIRAEISGKVNVVSSNVFTGADVTQGDLLFTIDDRSYRNALAEATASRHLVQQALEIEKGRQTIAKTEWNMLEKARWHGNKNKSLALRKPQLKEREAAVQMALAREAQATLDVERTRITAPCSGIILSENLATGQFLDTGDVAMQIGCTDSYYITALFSREYSVNPGTHTVEVNTGSNRYEGVIKSVSPRINSETRQKEALVEFHGKDVTLGSYVMLMLPGPLFKNATLLPKEALRSGSTVWILSENNTLEIRTVSVLAKDRQTIVVGKGIIGAERVILTHIASPLVGMKLSMLTEQP